MFTGKECPSKTEGHREESEPIGLPKFPPAHYTDLVFLILSGFSMTVRLFIKHNLETGLTIPWVFISL